MSKILYAKKLSAGCLARVAKEQGHSIINISGLAIGMAVALLIGLWIRDELTFDHYDPLYKRVAQVMQSQTFNGFTQTKKAVPAPLGTALRKNYGNDFGHVVMATWAWQHIVSAGDKMLSQSGNFMEPDAPRVLGPRMVEGSARGLEDASSILFARSLARSLFGDADPLHKVVQPVFWIAGILFTVFTGVIAGSYPALYLSSFRPIKVLKGTARFRTRPSRWLGRSSFKAGRYAAVPRQVLVVLQFAVSVVLIIGTIVVFKQIEFAKTRPVGYAREGLVMAELSTDDVHRHFDAIRNDLLHKGVVAGIAESTSPTTETNDNTRGLSWEGKDPAMTADFADIGVSFDYGKTVGWEFVEGRDFSRQLLTDSDAIVLNEAAVSYMRLQHPVGKIVRMWDKDREVIGVIKDMVMDSPYEPVKQTIYYLNGGGLGYLNIRIRPEASAHAAIDAIGKVWKVYSPAAPFTYRFVDKSYAIKFAEEERVGRLAGVFALLAIFISCLGLFGMASFMAEQRAGEIGVRKVLGATVFSVWRLLSKDFLVLVGLALVIALPAGYYFMSGWLRHYPYRTGMPWWIFAAAGAGAIVITVLTVSYQAVRAALTNPVKALRNE